MTKFEFHNWLRDWLKRRIAEVDGDEARLDIHQRLDGSNGHNRVVQVELPSRTEYVLKGDTTLAAIVQYLHLLQQSPDLSWERGEETPNGWRVNPGGEYLDDFEFYELGKCNEELEGVYRRDV